MRASHDKLGGGQASLGGGARVRPGGPGRSVLVFLGLAALVTLLFAVTPLDLVAARIFYDPHGVDHWPLAKQPPWSVLYGLAPWVTASLILTGLVCLIAGLARGHESLRQAGIFVVITVVLGPGLLINAVFKDHWDRPRPRDIVEFGGPVQYVIAPLRGEGGASFPCGHCSVGYLYGMGWWIWRRRRPRLAQASITIGLLTGTLMGLGRMAAGGHFLSDVIWSALLAFAVAHAVQFYLLPDTVCDRGPPAATSAVRVARTMRRQTALTVLAALGGIAVLVALFVTPHGVQLDTAVTLSSYPHPPAVFELAARAADVEMVLVDSPESELAISGELHGFGVPTGELAGLVQFDPEPIPTLYYRIEQRGWFTDLNGFVSIRLPVKGLERLAIHIGQGDISVRDLTHEQVIRSGRLRLDLKTSRGRVQSP